MSSEMQCMSAETSVRHSEKKSLIGRCIDICAANPSKMVLTDGEDVRSIYAAIRLHNENLAQVTLLGRSQVVRALLRSESIKAGLADCSKCIGVLDPSDPDFLARNIADYMQIVRDAGKSAGEGEVREYMSTGPAAGAMLVRRGEVEVGIGGTVSSTSDMIRAGLRILGVAPGGRTISSFSFLVAPPYSRDARKVLVFSDCGVVPEPNAEQLFDIAIGAAENFAYMTGEEPKVALLSFSSHGSAKHPRAKFVHEVAQAVRQARPAMLVDGELQFDAAISPEVARAKAPGSPLKGEANVLIFPSLEAANIATKVAERMGGYRGLGPLLQGLNGGWHDVSRGCSADDFYQVSLIGAVLARGTEQSK